jgi:ribosomal protein S18 acetylase RimI-like enzyme
MIRPTLPTDTPALLALAEATEVFKPIEIDALREVLDDYHASAAADGHRSVTWARGDDIVGFAYAAPAAMTDRTWYLWWIVVRPTEQARGIGSALLLDAEKAARQAQGRILLVETSSLPHYAPTRRFYEKHGYDLAAHLADFYADGDDMVVYRKRLGA